MVSFPLTIPSLQQNLRVLLTGYRLHSACWPVVTCDVTRPAGPVQPRCMRTISCHIVRTCTASCLDSNCSLCNPSGLQYDRFAWCFTWLEYWTSRVMWLSSRDNSFGSRTFSNGCTLLSRKQHLTHDMSSAPKHIRNFMRQNCVAHYHALALSTAGIHVHVEAYFAIQNSTCDFNNSFRQ